MQNIDSAACLRLVRRPAQSFATNGLSGASGIVVTSLQIPAFDNLKVSLIGERNNHYSAMQREPLETLKIQPQQPFHCKACDIGCQHVGPDTGD